jgi:hypothetical protein
MMTFALCLSNLFTYQGQQLQQSEPLAFPYQFDLANLMLSILKESIECNIQREEDGG